MRCPSCQHENPPSQKFCGECGGRLLLVCRACGHANQGEHKFCGECGASLTADDSTASAAADASPSQRQAPERHGNLLASRSTMQGERKQVTVLFADLKGSMEMVADRDPEDARAILGPVLSHMMEAVHLYEGTVNQVMGDGIMALFGAPIAREDHAVRACYAALRMHQSVRQYAEQAFSTHGVRVDIRVGLNSGEVVVGGIGSDLRMEYTAVGQTAHLAARMEQLATPGTSLLTAATLHLAEGFVIVKPRGPVPVKGLTERVEVYELTGASLVRSRLQAASARGLTKFVGRHNELTAISAALERGAARS
jgi:class 3 adenylate cyclase